MIDDFLKDISTLAIFGHVRPDGDCVGSTLALYNYITDNYPNIKTRVYLEKFPESYKILNGADKALPLFESSDGSEPFDAAVLMDTPSFERVGAGGVACLQSAQKTCNIDHHISNPKNLCSLNIVEPSASSASQVLFEQLDPSKISKRTAECLYLGIVHDTGAFKFSNTGKRTMEIVGTLIDKGIDFARIVNETYYSRTYKQTLVTGHVLSHCKLALDGRVVHAYVTPETLKEFDVTPVDLSNVIDTLREVSGTEVALFLYPVNGKYKISLRSNYVVDVNSIAKEFGGGGHTRAAGGDTDLSPDDAIRKILELVKKQLI